MEEILVRELVLHCVFPFRLVIKITYHIFNNSCSNCKIRMYYVYILWFYFQDVLMVFVRSDSKPIRNSELLHKGTNIYLQSRNNRARTKHKVGLKSVLDHIPLLELKSSFRKIF